MKTLIPALALILILFQQQAAAGASPSPLLTREEQSPGRQPARKLKFQADALACREKKKVIDKLEGSMINASSTSFGHNNDEEERLINTADYQVVTTHNSPSPNHPKP